MLDFLEVEENIKRGKIENTYIFCGSDEALIKECIKNISKIVLDSTFGDINHIQLDGATLDVQYLIDNCETIPFMADRKLVVAYRCNFLSDGEGKDDAKRYEIISKYVENVPSHCVLILYYIFENDREKPSKRVSRLEKKAAVARIDKLKGQVLERKVKEIFDSKSKEIGKVELKLFCDGLDNNMEIVKNEVDKLISYTDGREIKKEDVITMLPPKTDNDIFDLVDAISQKKAEMAVDILNELIFKGEKPTGILFMIERQFSLLFNIRIGIEAGKSKDMLVKELRLNPYICEKMITQSRRFTVLQLKKAMKYCLNTEESLKSSTSNSKVAMELLIISTLAS